MNSMGMGSMHGEMSSLPATFPFGHPGAAERVDRVIRVMATEFKYLPAAIEVRAGETVRFVITNTGTLDHEFVLGSSSEQQEHETEMSLHPNSGMHDRNAVAVPKGKTASLIWTFTGPMTIRYACHLPGHYVAGMYGVLTVEAE
jgi:uncharacterized cupredoxin-like copper-binding protein